MKTLLYLLRILLWKFIMWHEFKLIADKLVVEIQDFTTLTFLPSVFYIFKEFKTYFKVLICYP
jgi:hypothetical protein